MKEWRSKYGRITETEILEYIVERGKTFYVVGEMLCTVHGDRILLESCWR